MVPCFQHDRTKASLLSQNLEQLTLTCGEFMSQQQTMREAHAISPLL
jgi:hypothetical protein